MALREWSFGLVLSKKTNEPMPDIHQSNVTTMIPDSSFHVVGARDIWTCPPVRGKSRYVLNSLSRPSVDKSVLGELDFYVTDMIQTFNGPSFPSPFYIVSKKPVIYSENIVSTARLNSSHCLYINKSWSLK